MDDLISRKTAIEEFEDMVTSVSVYGESAEARYATNARLRFIDKLNEIHSVTAVPLDKLCEWLQTNASYNSLTKRIFAEQWKEILIEWMEEQNA